MYGKEQDDLNEQFKESSSQDGNTNSNSSHNIIQNKL